ncbi:MAG: acyl carrier protein [Lacunisphaera sp.]|nr:acyl carrier protein [Lacunisphaera sp.]
MKTATALSAAPASAPTSREESIRHLPAAARAAFHQFQAAGDPATLDPVIFAILADFIPRASAVPLAELPGSTRLIDDLGFDSLAITEVVFFTEDLFGISISNEEIIQVRSLDDLRGFIRRKVAAPANS